MYIDVYRCGQFKQNGCVLEMATDLIVILMQISPESCDHKNYDKKLSSAIA